MQFTTLQKDMMQAMKDHDKTRKDGMAELKCKADGKLINDIVARLVEK